MIGFLAPQVKENELASPFLNKYFLRFFNNLIHMNGFSEYDEDGYFLIKMSKMLKLIKIFAVFADKLAVWTN